MANGLLEAPSGSHSTAQGSFIGLAKPLQRWKNKAKSDPAGVRSKIIFLGEDSATVWRPFMVCSRSGQPTLSICNLSAARRVPVEVANPIREVQPEINLLANPIKEKLFLTVPDPARWEWRTDTTTVTSGLPQREVQIWQTHQPRISRFDEPATYCDRSVPVP